MKRIVLSICPALLLLTACGSFDDTALREELTSGGERLELLEGSLADIRLQLEALRDADCVTDVVLVREDGALTGFRVVFGKALPITIMLAKAGAEGVCSVELVGDRAVFTLSDGASVEILYNAAPSISLSATEVFVDGGGFRDVSYTIAGGDAENRVEAVAGGYWRSTVSSVDAFTGKVRIRAPSSVSDGSVLLLVTDGSGRSGYASVKLRAMSKESSATNRYSMAIYLQPDGSYATDASQSAVLDGAEPEGLYEPFATTPLVGSSSVADIEHTEVVYKTYADRELHMNICKAAGKSVPAPVVFLIHGGGWWAGDHGSLLKVAKYMAKHSGAAGVSVQYSLAGQTDAYIETSVEDLRDALSWLEAHAEEYNLDMSRVAFMGNSAGGHLSAVMAMTWPQSKVFVGWSGAYDIVWHLSYWGNDVNKVQRYFHKRDPEALAPYSPVLLVPSAPVHPVACMLLHGTADNQVLFGQAPLFAEALRNAGQKVSEEYYQWYSHGLVGSSDKNAECLSKTLDFIKENL